MAWTAPKTWVVGAVLTAADLNTHLRDNLAYLKGGAGTVTLDAGQNVSGAVVATNNPGAPDDTLYSRSAIAASGTGTGVVGALGFRTPGKASYAIYADPTTGVASIRGSGGGGTTSGSSKTLWHSGNDGPGSGLDADTVDGRHAETLLVHRTAISGAGMPATADIGVIDNNSSLTLPDITLVYGRRIEVKNLSGVSEPLIAPNGNGIYSTSWSTTLTLANGEAYTLYASASAVGWLVI